MKARPGEPYSKVVDVVDVDDVDDVGTFKVDDVGVVGTCVVLGAKVVVVLVVVGGRQSLGSGFAAQACSDSFLQAALHFRLAFPLSSLQSVRQVAMSFLQSLLHFFFFAASADPTFSASAQSRIRSIRFIPIVPMITLPSR